MTELFDLQRASRKFAHDSNTFSGARERDIEEELLDSDMDKGSNQYDRGRSGYEDCYDERDHTLLLPPNIPRQGFNSKRHPSFDAPREVPFPCGHLTSPVSPLLCHPQHGPSTNVPMCLQDGPGRWSPSQMDADGDSPDGNVNNASESSPSLWPNMEHLSTTSLPLPTFMPYTVLPPLSTPVPPSRFNDGRTPPQVRQSSLNTTESGLEPSMAPGTTLLQPPEAEFKSTIKLPSPANVTHPSRLPGRMSTEPPPLLTDELHATDLAPSHESSQPSSLDSTPHHDTRPHNSLPPPPKISSFSFTSAPLARPTSLPHSIVNGSLDSQLTSCSGGSRFPPPQPPTVLTPPPPPSATENTRTRAPYEPFLPRDQPPPDRTYIAVETLNTEYRLIIRLFGFQRDSMCALFPPHSMFGPDKHRLATQHLSNATTTDLARRRRQLERRWWPLRAAYLVRI